MEKSRDDYEEERTVPDEEDEEDWFAEPEDEDRDSPKKGTAEGESAETVPSEPVDLFLLVRGGTSFVSDPYFDNPFDMEVLLGTQGDGHWGIFAFAGFKTLDVQSDAGIAASIESHPLILDLGVEVRYYPFVDWGYLSPYVTGRISGFILFWRYRNDLIAGNETISSDYVGGAGFDAGLGIDFIRTDRFQAGFLLLPQSFLFGEETAEGFTNDIFDSYGTVRWTFEAGFKL